MAYKYAKDLVTIKSKQTFSIEPHFFVAQSKNEESPLPIVGSTSRFRATIINESREPVTVRWSTSEVNAMAEDFAIARAVAKELEFKGPAKSAVPENANSLAYTKKFMFGSLKGLSPAEAFLQGTTMDEMQKQYEFIKSNLEKYPKNKELLQAIQEAGILFQKGEIKPCAAPTPTAKDMVVFESSMKPLVRNENGDGTCPVYQSQIVVHPTDKFPVEVVLTNFDAPVIKNTDGRLNVIAKEKKNEKKNSMRMSFADFGFVIKEMQDYISYFKMLNCKSCYADSDACDKENRLAAQQSAS